MTVAEFDFPGNGAFLLFSANPDAVSQRRKIGVSSNVNCILRAGLYTGIALPAHVWFNIDRPAVGFVDMHDIRGADIYAVSATIAASHVYKCWHFNFYF